MATMKYILTFLLLYSYVSAENATIKSIFDKYALDGTFVVTSLEDNSSYIYNTPRANKRYPTASTFKIPHTLIALEEGVVASTNDVIKWDGIQREYPLWNQDQTLRSALQYSCVWCYKEFTKHIPQERYQNYLEAFEYGNKIIGADKSSFWLNGSLQITAMEQIMFLRKLYNNALPISLKSMQIVKEIMHVEDEHYFELYAKSGFSGLIGWYVGYIRVQKGVYFFALNADVKKEQLPLRKQIVLESLQALGIIEQF